MGSVVSQTAWLFNGDVYADDGDENLSNINAAHHIDHMHTKEVQSNPVVINLHSASVANTNTIFTISGASNENSLSYKFVSNRKHKISNQSYWVTMEVHFD